MSDNNVLVEKIDKENENLIEELVLSVKQRSVYGKVPVGTSVGGVVLEKASAAGAVGAYQEVGPDAVAENNDFDKVNSVMNTVARGKDVAKFVGTSFEKYIDSDFFSVVQDGESAIVSLHFFQDTSERVPEGYRGHSLARLSAVMPYENSRKLVEIVQNDPDRLEDFFSKTFVGVQDDPIGDRHGLRRVRTNGFYYMDPMHIALIPDKLDTRKVLDADKILKELKHFEYKNGPYGIGEPFKESK